MGDISLPYRDDQSTKHYCTNILVDIARTYRPVGHQTKLDASTQSKSISFFTVIFRHYSMEQQRCSHCPRGSSLKIALCTRVSVERVIACRYVCMCIYGRLSVSEVCFDTKNRQDFSLLRPSLDSVGLVRCSVLHGPTLTRMRTLSGRIGLVFCSSGSIPTVLVGLPLPRNSFLPLP